MSVDFDALKQIAEYRAKRQKMLVMTATQAHNLAMVNMGDDYRKHVDTGASSMAKTVTPIKISSENFQVRTGMNYDIYLERRYGIMRRVADMIEPYAMDYVRAIFGK